MNFAPMDASPSDEDRPVVAYISDDASDTEAGMDRPASMNHMTTPSPRKQAPMATKFERWSDRDATSPANPPLSLCHRIMSSTQTTVATLASHSHLHTSGTSIATPSTHHTTDSPTDDSSSEESSQRPNGGRGQDAKPPLNVSIQSRLHYASRCLAHTTGCWFRIVLQCYAHRQGLVLAWVHGVATMLIGAYFAMDVAATETNWTNGLDLFFSLHFGLVHAILLQVVLVPLTLLHSTTGHVRVPTTPLFGDVIPWHRHRTMCHYLTSTCLGLVVVDAMAFWALYQFYTGDTPVTTPVTTGTVWSAGVMALSILVVAVTTCRRDRSQVVGSSLRHVAFGMLHGGLVAHIYFLSPDHFVDRFPAYLCLFATMIYYVCDRVAMNVNHTYKSNVVASSLVSGINGTKMIALVLRRPVLFHFEPGQYARLRLRKLSNEWRPFTVASNPDDASELQFYLPVHADDAWTTKLWNILEEDRDCALSRHIGVEIKGPMGLALDPSCQYTHVMAIASDTGIVPILSQFKQHVHRLVEMDPDEYAFNLRRQSDRVYEARNEDRSRRESVAQRILRFCGSEKKSYRKLDETHGHSMKRSCLPTLQTDVKKLSGEEPFNFGKPTAASAQRAQRQIYGTLALTAIAVTGTTFLGLLLSWVMLHESTYSHAMMEAVRVTGVGLQVCFGLLALFVRDARDVATYFDIVVTCTFPFLDWYTLLETFDADSMELVFVCLLLGYITVRTWTLSVNQRFVSWTGLLDSKMASIQSTERYDVIWVADSASMVSELLPDLEDSIKLLVEAWGKQCSDAACSVTVYVTDEDVNARALLMTEVNDSLVYLNESIRFGSPDFAALLLDRSSELIGTRQQSQTLINCVSDSRFARQLHQTKLINDLTTFMMDEHSGNHETVFRCSSYITERMV